MKPTVKDVVTKYMLQKYSCNISDIQWIQVNKFFVSCYATVNNITISLHAQVKRDCTIQAQILTETSYNSNKISKHAKLFKQSVNIGIMEFSYYR
jgi:hypothetical protein